MFSAQSPKYYIFNKNIDATEIYNKPSLSLLIPYPLLAKYPETTIDL